MHEEIGRGVKGRQLGVGNVTKELRAARAKAVRQPPELGAGRAVAGDPQTDAVGQVGDGAQQVPGRLALVELGHGEHRLLSGAEAEPRPSWRPLLW
jgi:hypothetical protein